MAPRGKEPGEQRVAVVAKRGRFWVGEPLFEPGAQVPLADGRRVGDGSMALIELRPGKARVLRELGSPDNARDVIEAMLVERGVQRGFEGRIEGEAADAAAGAPERGLERRDLTELATLTVDPATARDFDDAVSASPSGDGIRLWIHIADVAAHVRPGSGLEREAHRRSTSTYVPGTVEPMLPHALSSEACSLAPGEERLAVTAEIELAPSGEARSTRFYRSRVRSNERLDYDQLDRIFAGGGAPKQVAEPLELARRAAAALAERRRKGSLEIVGSEPEFLFEGGEVTGARRVEQTEAHRLIEQLMILTNERVAELLERRGVPTLYRVHEQPDPERVRVLVEQLGALEIPTPSLPKAISPSQAGGLVVEASRLARREGSRRGYGTEAYTTLVLRALKQAYYSDRNLGHAGLGSPAYSHFTSPIRRYPDLIAHRALLSAVGQGESAPAAGEVAEAGPYASEREREAMRVERDADDVCAAFLLRRELREAGPEQRFEGEVVGVIGAGAFIGFGGRLADVYRGFLPARLLGGRERYDLDETETALVGAGSGDRLRLGDPVRVTVERIEEARGRVDLAPVQRRQEGRRGREGGRGRRQGQGRKRGRGR